MNFALICCFIYGFPRFSYSFGIGSKRIKLAHKIQDLQLRGPGGLENVRVIERMEGPVDGFTDARSRLGMILGEGCLAGMRARPFTFPSMSFGVLEG